VQGAWAEAAASPHTAEQLAAELRLLAGWLGLDGVVVAEKGDLSGRLSPLLARS
jgi:uncharacterized protein YcaQ